MEIRQAVPKDAELIKKIHTDAYKVCYRGYLPDDELDAMKVDEEHIQRTAVYIQKVESWVVEEDNQVVGFAYVTYPEMNVFEINALYVHPNHQRKGVGTALISKLCVEKKVLGYDKVIIWTLKNGPSIGFYQKKGFRKVEGEEKMWKHNLPIIQFEKKL